MRAGCMGNLIPTGLDAPVRLANALERGEHVGMLVDQHFGKGVDVVFFGRWAKANPLIAQLARHTECPIRGVRVVRQPDGNSFWGELTDEIDAARDADGKIDIQGTMQVITGVVEALGARASGTMALAASAVAVKCRHKSVGEAPSQEHGRRRIAALG